MEGLIECILVQVLQQITAGGHRSTLEWHLDEHNSGFVRMLCLDRIALPPQPRSHLLATHLDRQEETSTDEEEVSHC